LSTPTIPTSAADNKLSGRPRTFTLPERRETKKIATSKPAEHGLPFSTRSLAELADFLVAEGWSTTSATRVCASCSTSSPTPVGSGPSAAGSTRTPTGSPGPDTGRPTPARTGSGTYIIWRNKHIADIRLRTLVTRVNVA
jgi:hypothetical protein